jgi:GTP-binding protein HflX
MRRERERAQLPTVTLVGYTNAGKSSLLNALTGADAGVRERLFHTLDPTTRSLEVAGRSYLVTDTVGFIRKLPHQLVDAFGATLEEALEADLLVHVVDASARDELEAMVDAVDEVLAEIGAGDRPVVTALNKVDLLDAERRRELGFRRRDAVQVSAETGEGLDDLKRAIEARFLSGLRSMELLVPYREGGSLSELHDVAGEMDRQDTAEGALIRARVPAGAAARFERFERGADGNGAAPE